MKIFVFFSQRLSTLFFFTPTITFFCYFAIKNNCTGASGEIFCKYSRPLNIPMYRLSVVKKKFKGAQLQISHCILKSNMELKRIQYMFQRTLESNLVCKVYFTIIEKSSQTILFRYKITVRFNFKLICSLCWVFFLNPVIFIFIAFLLGLDNKLQSLYSLQPQLILLPFFFLFYFSVCTRNKNTTTFIQK